MFNFSRYNSEYNECVAKGVCSTLPGISALIEVFFIIIRQIAYYLLKLKMIGEDTKRQDKILITLLAYEISGSAFGDNQILRLVNSAYTNLQKIRRTYTDRCKEFGLEKVDVKHLINLTPQMNLSDIISFGEKVFHDKYKTITYERKNYSELLSLIIKHTAENLVQLFDYEVSDDKYILEILEGLNLMNRTNVSLNKYRTAISNLAAENNKILENLFEIRTKKYGKIRQVKLSYSTDKGKAILVSGTCLEDLKALLDFTSEAGIDIYTHDDLLSAHLFEEFSKYKNLKGQFGICQENCVLDFATFPGAIFLTKNSKINTDYLYRGRLFTTSEIIPQGAVKIIGNDFEPLLSSAINSKGFAKGQTRPEEIIGFDENSIKTEFKSLSEKINKGKINKVKILGTSHYRNEEYDKIIKNTNKNDYILSFSHENISADNCLKVNVGNGSYLINKILKFLFNFIPVNSEKLEFYFSKCDASSLSLIIYLKECGIKNIHVLNCRQNSVSPALKDFILKEYNIS